MRREGAQRNQILSRVLGYNLAILKGWRFLFFSLGWGLLKQIANPSLGVEVLAARCYETI